VPGGGRGTGGSEQTGQIHEEGENRDPLHPPAGNHRRRSANKKRKGRKKGKKARLAGPEVAGGRGRLGVTKQ